MFRFGICNESGASGGYNASYTYSTNGQMLTKSEQYAYTLNYPGAGQAHPHAATNATSSNGGPTFNMTYDANGNMTLENSDTFTYNGDNQLIKHVISGGATITYVYDGQGNLVKKSSTDGTSTVYIGGIYEKHQDGSYITYYNSFGRRIAMRKHTGPSDTTGTLYFFLADTLGSTSTILSSAGTVVESEKYYPYGGLRSGGPGGQGITTTDKQFTGQQNEGTAFGLYDYGARFYSTVTGQFTSADPKVQSTHDPLSWDRYAYALDNPLRYTDPTGLDASDLVKLAKALNARGISGGDFEREMSARSASRLASDLDRAGISGAKFAEAMGGMMQAAGAASDPNEPIDAAGLAFYAMQAYWQDLHMQAIQANAVDYAWEQAVEGKPYVKYANGPNGFDCSGLVQWSYIQAAGFDVVGRSTYHQWPNTTHIARSQLRPGDLVFYLPDANGNPGHVAMYVGKDPAGHDMIVESPNVGEDVRVREMGDDAMGYGRPHF